MAKYRQLGVDMASARWFKMAARLEKVNQNHGKINFQYHPLKVRKSS